MAREVAQTTTVVGPPARGVSSRVRVLRRTNVYIAEYILMLMFFGAFLGVLVALWFSFFGLITAEGYAVNGLRATVVGLLASLLVVGPVSYWLYSRVTGEEAANPAVVKHKARTVFLVLWLIGAVSGLVMLLTGAMGGIVSSIFGMADAGPAFVNVVIPSLLAAGTVGFGTAAITKHTTRKLAMTVGIVLASIAAILFIANTVMVLVKKDSARDYEYTPSTRTSTPSRSTTTSRSSDECTVARYLDDECSYEEYLEDFRYPQ